MIRKSKKSEKDESSQLEISLPKTQGKPFFKIKRFFRNIEYRISIIPYWRNGIIWLSLIGVVASAAITSLLLYIKRSELPEEIPLLYNQDTQQWTVVSDDLLYAFPIVFAVLSISLFYLFPKTFYVNKRLTLTLTLSLFYSNLITIIAMLELIFMVIR